MTTYRERREARAERLQEWAAKREAKAEADSQRASDMASVIPFGQPILAGHYSEGRDRRYRDRIGQTMDRAIENERKAESMASRARTIESQLAESIYDDDPDAIQRLRERVEALEAQREQRKADNAAYRKAHKAELAAMTAYERNQSVPWPSYSITNLGGNIKRNRDRLVSLERRAERTERTEASGGTLVEPVGSGYVRVTFAQKPARDVLDELKAAGFRWGKGSWVGSADRVPASVTATPDSAPDMSAADTMSEALERLAETIRTQTHERLVADCLRSYPGDTERAEMAAEVAVNVKPGKDYTKIDVGPSHNMSGKYMVEHSSGIIYGIKGYGQVHKGHQYGTMATVDQWWWGGYTAVAPTTGGDSDCSRASRPDRSSGV